MWKKTGPLWNMSDEGGFSNFDTHMAEDGSKILFREVQRFRQTWLWVMMGIPPIIAICGIGVAAFVSGASHKPVKAMDPIALVAGVVGVLGYVSVLVLMHVCNLCVEVRETGLFVRYFPFHLSFHRIPLEDVKSFQPVIYRPILEYGGWGIKYGWKSKAYSVSGNRGVKLEFYSGRSLLIGSHKPEKMAEALSLIIRR
jgi:hypothetical protein